MTETDHAPSARVRWAPSALSDRGSVARRPRRRRGAQKPHRGARRASSGAIRRRAAPDPLLVQDDRADGGTSPRAAKDPFAALARRVHGHTRARTPASAEALADAIARQHRDHPRWSFQLHHDNLLALAREDPRLGTIPSYPTVARFHERAGAAARRANAATASRTTASRSLRARRVRTRSLTSTAFGTWTFTKARGPYSLRRGQWQTPQLLGILDDRSLPLLPISSGISTRPPRPSCMACRRLSETRTAACSSLPTTVRPWSPRKPSRGLERLGVSPIYDQTLPYSPETKRKTGIVLGTDRRPAFAHARGRARAHARSAQYRHPSLGRAGIPTCKVHSEIRESPLDHRICVAPASAANRPAPDALRRALRTEVSRKQRRSDGTVTVDAGVRFEGPRRVPHPPATAPPRRPMGSHQRRPHVDPAPAITWSRFCRSTRLATPSAFGASSLPPIPPWRLVAPSASRRTCVPSWPNTPPPVCPPPILPKHDPDDDPTEDS